MESNLINTSAEIKELYDLLSNSNHWLIQEWMRVHHIEENGAMHIFYEKHREFADDNGRCLKAGIKFKDGYTYTSPFDQVSSKVNNEDISLYGGNKCDIYEFVNHYIPQHPGHTDVVESLICKIEGIEFSITPDYAYLMYLEVLNKSKLQETPIELGNPDAILNISY